MRVLRRRICRLMDTGQHKSSMPRMQSAIAPFVLLSACLVDPVCNRRKLPIDCTSSRWLPKKSSAVCHTCSCSFPSPLNSLGITHILSWKVTRLLVACAFVLHERGGTLLWPEGRSSLSAGADEDKILLHVGFAMILEI